MENLDQLSPMLDASWCLLFSEANVRKKYNLYLRSAMFIVLARPSKQLKEIIQTEHNIVENSNWLEANLAYPGI